MTEEEMRNRIKEIDKERNRLKQEKEEYEKYFSDKKIQEELDHHKQYVGKCFRTRNDPGNKQSHIKAFKILNILDAPNERYAQCVILVDGLESNVWKEKAVKIQTIGLWNPNEFRMMSSPSELKVIDFYKEISQEEFDTLYEEYLKELNKRVYN